MKFSKVLENTVGALTALKFVRDPKLGKLDFAVLEVALMISALDGKVQKDEVEAFLALAKKCRGANAKSVKAVYDEALRAAGYISILVQLEEEKAVLAAFADEVVKVMPENFLEANPEDIRRAFVIWTAMAMSDGEYSGIERKAVELLEKRFTVIKSAKLQEILEREAALSPAFRVAYGDPAKRPAAIRLLPAGFLAAAEVTLSKAKGAAIAELVTND